MNRIPEARKGIWLSVPRQAVHGMESSIIIPFHISFLLVGPAYRAMRYVRTELREKARKDFPHSPAGKACSKTVAFSGSRVAKTVKNQ